MSQVFRHKTMQRETILWKDRDVIIDGETAADPGGSEISRKRCPSPVEDESINKIEIFPKKSKVQIDSSLEHPRKVNNSDQDNSDSHSDVKTASVLNELVIESTNAPEQQCKNIVLSSKPMDFFKKSLKQQVEELAIEQGMEAEYSFLKPPGYKYMIGQRGLEGNYEVCLTLTRDSQTVQFAGLGSSPYPAIREASKRARRSSYQVFLTSRRSFKKVFPNGPKIAPKPYIHHRTIRRRLNEDPETILKILKLEPNEVLSSSEQFRIGSRGSLCINREKTDSCPKGIWYNFETDETGDMFELAKAAKDLSDQEMIEFAVKNILPHLKVGFDDTVPSSENDEEVALPKVSTASYAKRILSELLPLEGSTAEEYLQNHRKIKLISSKNLKFHPDLSCKASFGGFLNSLPGLVSIASHPRSKDVNLQITYLDPSTGNKHADVAIPKKTFGSFHDPQGFHSCEICENVNQKVTFVCEGVETALSIHQAFPEDHLIATLGKHNFSRVDPEILNQKIVLVFDNDGLDISDDKVFNTAARRLAEAGKDVYIVLPPLVGGLDKSDMNDVLVHFGEEGVYKVVVENMKKVKV